MFFFWSNLFQVDRPRDSGFKIDIPIGGRSPWSCGINHDFKSHAHTARLLRIFFRATLLRWVRHQVWWVKKNTIETTSYDTTAIVKIFSLSVPVQSGRGKGKNKELLLCAVVQVLIDGRKKKLNNNFDRLVIWSRPVTWRLEADRVWGRREVRRATRSGAS